jgi:hypothetical protein
MTNVMAATGQWLAMPGRPLSVTISIAPPAARALGKESDATSAQMAAAAIRFIVALSE